MDSHSRYARAHGTRVPTMTATVRGYRFGDCRRITMGGWGGGGKCKTEFFAGRLANTAGKRVYRTGDVRVRFALQIDTRIGEKM